MRLRRPSRRHSLSNESESNLLNEENKSTLNSRLSDIDEVALLQLFDESQHKMPFYRRYSKRLMFLSALLGCLFGMYILEPLLVTPAEEIQRLLRSMGDPAWEAFSSSETLLALQVYLRELSQQLQAFSTVDDPLPPSQVARARVNFNFDCFLLVKGWKAHFPVVLIPGMTSTGLELWEGKECCKTFFRERLWGTTTMLRLLVTDKSCWLTHLLLDPDSFLDPEGIKLRSAQGLSAADYLLPGYWVWGKIIEALGDIGYDPNTLSLAAYDWRLSFGDLERRDRYFSKLKALLEQNSLQEKSVVVSHSLGALVWHYFMTWVEHEQPGWVDKHVESVISIGAPLLGLPKALSSLVSGEMKDTAQLGLLESYIVDTFISRKERTMLFQNWLCLYALLPKGSKDLWAIDDDHDERLKDGSFLWVNGTQVDADTMKPFLRNVLPESCQSRLAIDMSWGDPLKTPLPNAPFLKMYCAYGVGQPTERGYMYTHTEDGMIVDVDVEGGNIRHGVLFRDGDGTVPALSAGYLPIIGWQNNSSLNPYNVTVFAREYRHDPISPLSSRGIHVRGGPHTSDHVDILGNHQLTLDILQIVSNNNHGDQTLGEQFHSSLYKQIKEKGKKE